MLALLELAGEVGDYDAPGYIVEAVRHLVELVSAHGSFLFREQIKSACKDFQRRYFNGKWVDSVNEEWVREQ